MPQLNDAMYTALRTQFYTGAVNDMVAQWLLANGATGGALPDLWEQFFDARSVGINLFDEETVTARIEGAATVVGTVYRIVSQSTLDFTSVGSPNNIVRTVFIADAVDTLGSGDALDQITAPNTRISGRYIWPGLAGPLEDSGNPTDNTFYRIMTQSIVDFTTVGAPDNNVGTYFYSTGIGVTLSAVDSLRTVGLSWKPYDINKIELDETENAIKISYVDDNRGGYVYLRNIDDLISNLTIGVQYVVNLDAKFNAIDHDQAIAVYHGSGGIFTIVPALDTEWNSYEIVFTCLDIDSGTIRPDAFDTGDIAWIRNLSIREYIGNVLDDRAFFWLRSLGYTGSLNDMWLAFWVAGGTF